MKLGLKPAEIAAQCGVTSNTVRNWSKEFRSHLSEGANAAERIYTDRDSTILRYISNLKQEGLKAHEIAERLAEMSFGETESPETKPAAIVPSEVHQNASDKQDLTPALIVALDTINAMQRRLEAVEALGNDAKREASAAARDEVRKTQRDMLVVFMAGAITMGVVILLFVAIVWLYGK